MTARIDPKVISVVRAIHDRKLIPCEHVIEILQDIDNTHPALSFSDFVKAIRLALLGSREPRGRA
jgi:hypothetical protein